MQRLHYASVMANMDNVVQARETTEKLRMKQAEHEEIERKKREEVFTQYMQRRLKAEEKVVSLHTFTMFDKCNVEQINEAKPGENKL